MMKSAHVPKHISMRESHSIQTTEEIIYGPTPFFKKTKKSWECTHS